MSRHNLDGCCKIWLLVLVCTVGIAAADDSWAMAISTESSSGLSIVAVDDDDFDDQPDHVMPSACSSVYTTNRRSCVRKPTDCPESVDLAGNHGLRSVPRGPPAGLSDKRGRENSIRFRPIAVASSIVVPPPAPAIPHHSWFKRLLSCSRNRTIGAYSDPRCKFRLACA